MDDFVLTAHAAQMARERGLELEWIGLALREPSVTRPDVRDANLTHVFRRFPQAGNRMLRVVFVSASEPPRVITVFLDRKASRELP